VKPFGSDYLRYIPEKYLKWNGDAPEWDREFISAPVQCYLFTTGFWQYWDMFAPNPSNIDFWCDCVIHYKNGSQSVYEYPRMYSLPISQKFLKERYRKFFERAHDDRYTYLYGAFGDRIALLNYHDPNNPPVKVEVLRHWREIADPGQPQQSGYYSYVYYTRIINQASLKAAAARKY